MRKIFFSMIALMMSVVMNAATFTITDNQDGTVTVVPAPEETFWAAYAYPEGNKGTFLSMFMLDESMTDAEIVNALMSMYVPVTRGAGEGDFSISDFMDNFGGAEAGNYTVCVVELNADGEAVGESTTKTVAFTPVDMELEMNYAESDTYTSDVDILFMNEEWYARFDVKEVPVVAGKTYTINDLDLQYSYMKKKDAEFAQDWTKYTYESVSFTMKENGNMDALVTVKDSKGNTMTVSMYYEVNDQRSITLSGEYEVVNGVVAVTAKNVARDYSLLLNIVANDLENFGMYNGDNLTAVGNSVQTPWNKDSEKVVDADIFAMAVDNNMKLMGTVTGEYTDDNGKKIRHIYNIDITLTKVNTEGQDYQFDLGTLTVSEDEGDIKLEAKNDEHRFVGYITCATTDVPSGTYDLLSDSKFGDYDAELDYYWMQEITDGKVVVVNDGNNISITATFKQGNNSYTIKAAGTATGIKNIEAATAGSVAKYLDNGRLVILKGGKKYGVDAVEVK